jgi:predicted Zn-dependent protease
VNSPLKRCRPKPTCLDSIGKANTGFAALAVVWLLAVGGCSVNPATGKTDFTPFMGPAQEARIGAQEHPKMIEEFGGVYDDIELTGYVATIGGRLAANSELPDLEFTFTVLNSPVVNAFAMPGGYVYVTRGLIALANSEAELAGVLAHEIGHVTGRHSAQRYSRAMATGMGMTILDAWLGGGAASQAAQLGAHMYLASYSRAQENEADVLGIRYLRRAGYDPYAEADFLRSLSDHSQLLKQIYSPDSRERSLDQFFASHPQTSDRVLNVIRAAGGVPEEEQTSRLRDRFLDQIRDMVYGDSPDDGFIRKQTFSHPDLGFTFTVPKGYRITNSPGAVLAKGPNGAMIIFDAAPQPPRYMGMADYLVGQWGKGSRLSDVETIDINGMEAATGWTTGKSNGQTVEVRFIAIRFSKGQIFRFQFATPVQWVTNMAEELQRTTYSFRKLSAVEKDELKPLRVRIARVRDSDSVSSLSAAMAYNDFKEERFRVLNALDGNATVTPGARVKLITE